MNVNKLLFNVTVAAAVAAVTAVGTSYLVFGYAPLGTDGAPMSVDRARIEQITRDYLTKNPEILVEMTNALDKRQAAEEETQQKKAISQNADKIFRSPLSHVAGNPNGDVNLVEFFDYNCGYCRKAMPEVVKLINEDGKVRLVLKELPIFGDDSEAAAKLALASDKQGKYFEMHQNILRTRQGRQGESLGGRKGAWARCRSAAKGRGRPRHQEVPRPSQGPCPETQSAGDAAVLD